MEVFKMESFRSHLGLGTVVHAYNPNTLRLKQEYPCELLGLQKGPVFKKEKKETKDSGKNEILTWGFLLFS